MLAGLIVLATVGFVVGTTIERNSGESKAHVAAERTAGSTGETAERPEQRAAEGQGGTMSKHKPELRPLGVDVEAPPFVALAAAASLALAFAVWRRPELVPLLVGVALAMALFAVLDVREVFHQDDEGRTGLAILAGTIAVLHLGAAIVAAQMGRETRETAS